MLIAKTLKSAVANAENNANLRADTLVVKEAVIGEGPTLKRFRPRAMGRASHLAGTPLPERYFRFLRYWFLLGWPAFIGVLAIFYLMVLKPDL